MSNAGVTKRYDYFAVLQAAKSGGTDAIDLPCAPLPAGMGKDGTVSGHVGTAGAAPRAEDSAELPEYRIGIDAGSKTIKVVIVDRNGCCVHSLYHRHKSDVVTTLASSVHEMLWRFGDFRGPLAITGSAGIGIADALGVPFVQEVIATTRAVKERHPAADCIIELGGEDAKVVYLTGKLEQRMNATCAGGTGDFIDGIAGLLRVRSRDFGRIAFGARRTYPIASRCAVFAQTDVRPLLNAGASKADIALSTLQAVVRQTLGGLACGRPIEGNVVFLGGPLNFNSALAHEFRKALGLDHRSGLRPRDAHLYTAVGAALCSEDGPVTSLSELEERLKSCVVKDEGLGHLPRLFENSAELEAFRARHADASLKRSTRSRTPGEQKLYLGLDAGSTSVKFAIVDEEGALVTSGYEYVDGNVLDTATKLMDRALSYVYDTNVWGARRRIVHATVTGYGEALLTRAFEFDSGVVETVAHVRAAREFDPKVSFVLDIGGQDMKATWVNNAMVEDTVLNEACSSGCGAFVKSSARALELNPDAFAAAALEARNPIDLGAKCTVFMNSRVRHAQKIGAATADIAAGIAYSVVNNALTRIIGADRVASMGSHIVVQGGTFKSDAVLQAFEKLCGVEVTRPEEAHLMGAYGAALTALDRAKRAPGTCTSTLITPDRLRTMDPESTSATCPGCANACTLSIIDFGNGTRFVNGNKCSTGEELFTAERRHSAPNAVAVEQELLGAYSTLLQDGERGQVKVGLVNAMNAYEATPFWHTLLTRLGFSVVVAHDAAGASIVERAAATIPSESVCFPAKLAHYRYVQLEQNGADVMLMPRFVRAARCPVASEYALALADNVDTSTLCIPILESMRPERIARSEHDRSALLDAFNGCAVRCAPVSADELDRCLQAALQEQSRFEGAVAAACDEALDWVHERTSRRGVVLIGRPYHNDPELLHAIDQELAQLDMAVLAPIGLRERFQPTRVPARWRPAKRLLKAAEYVSGDEQLELVAVRSFGCGYDAVAVDEARDAMRDSNRTLTELKIDDMADIAHVRIRLRTLAESSRARLDEHIGAPDTSARIPDTHEAPAFNITPDLCSTAKALCEHACAMVQEGTDDESLRVPIACTDCLTDALGYELSRNLNIYPKIEWVENAALDMSTKADPAGELRPRIGLVGNPLILQDRTLNDDIVGLLEALGADVAFPDLHLLETDDVRYLPQLDAFSAAGVDHVIYLQSFGCLKGHVRSRGALHEFALHYPDMPVTVIDYDREASALNRENRVRLAVEAARLKALGAQP